MGLGIPDLGAVVVASISRRELLKKISSLGRAQLLRADLLNSLSLPVGGISDPINTVGENRALCQEFPTSSDKNLLTSENAEWSRGQ